MTGLQLLQTDDEDDEEDHVAADDDDDVYWEKGYGKGCLMHLWALFQICYRGQFDSRRKSNYVWKSPISRKSPQKPLSHKIIPLYKCEFNFSDDGTDCIGRPSYHTKTDITVTNANKMQKYVPAWNYMNDVQPWMPDTVSLSLPL